MEYPDNRYLAVRHAAGRQPGGRYPELCAESTWRGLGVGGERDHNQCRYAAGHADHRHCAGNAADCRFQLRGRTS